MKSPESRITTRLKKRNLPELLVHKFLTEYGYDHGPVILQKAVDRPRYCGRYPGHRREVLPEAGITQDGDLVGRAPQDSRQDERNQHQRSGADSASGVY